MEVLLSEPIDLELVADLCARGIKRGPPIPRNYQAWHVTNLLESGRLIAKGDTCYYEFEGRPSGIMSLGRVWEAAVDRYLAYYAAQRGGFYVPDVGYVEDSIVASLDGIMYLPDLGWLVCESKLRFTLNEEIPLAHLQQVRAYCYAVDTDLVCYVSGHLSSTPPTARAAMRIIRLTKQSIEECWQGIVNTRDYLAKCGCSPTGEGE